MANENKKGLSTDSNAYTIIYAAVLVIIVAFLLSFVSSSLKERQDDNAKLDKKAQILSAINVAEDDTQAAYEKYVKKAIVLDANGNEKEGDGFMVDFAGESNEDNLPLYVCEVDGKTKYIIPLRGAGLWGPIWGYAGLNDDKNTVFGITFGHEGETAGLGSKIVENDFRAPFKGKQIKKNGEVKSIAVLKKGNKAEGQDQVDALSGATLTSNGVSDMLSTCFKKYEKFLTK